MAANLIILGGLTDGHELLRAIWGLLAELGVYVVHGADRGESDHLHQHRGLAGGAVAEREGGFAERGPQAVQPGGAAAHQGGGRVRVAEPGAGQAGRVARLRGLLLQAHLPEGQHLQLHRRHRHLAARNTRPHPRYPNSLDLQQDEFIVIACDGLFDIFDNQQVVDFARSRLLDMPTSEQVTS